MEENQYNAYLIVVLIAMLDSRGSKNRSLRQRIQMIKKCKTRKYMQRDHFYKRMSERFGIRVTKNDLSNLKAQITSDKSIFIEKTSNRVSLHGVKFNDTLLIVVYDKNRNELVTVLPKEDQLYKIFEVKNEQKVKENITFAER